MSLDVRQTIDRELRRRLTRLALNLSQRVPYDARVCYVVLELGLAVGLNDPEEFLVRCSSANLDPVEILSFLYFRKTGRLPEIQGLRPWPHWLRAARCGLILGGLLLAVASSLGLALLASCLIAASVTIVLAQTARSG